MAMDVETKEKLAFGGLVAAAVVVAATMNKKVRKRVRGFGGRARGYIRRQGGRARAFAGRYRKFFPKRRY